MLDVAGDRSWFRAVVLEVPFGDVYLHNPGRLRYLAVVAIAGAGGGGHPGTRGTSHSDAGVRARGSRAAPCCGSVCRWRMRARPVHFVFLALALVAGGCAALSAARDAPDDVGVGALVGACSRWSWWAARCTSQPRRSATPSTLGLESGEHPNLVPQPLPLARGRRVGVPAPTAFVPRLRATQDRYLTWAPPAASFEKGYLFVQPSRDWPALAMERGTLFGVRDVAGLQPRAAPPLLELHARARPAPVFYNAAVIDVPTARRRRGCSACATWSCRPACRRRLAGRGRRHADGYDLVEVGRAGRAARVGRCRPGRRGDSPRTPSRRRSQPGFDPASVAVLEADPGHRAGAGRGAGRRDVTETDTRARRGRRRRDGALDRGRAHAATTRGGRATVDGRRRPSLPADGFLPGRRRSTPGAHEVALTYRDAVDRAGSGAAIVAGALLLRPAWRRWSSSRPRRARGS